MAVVYVIHDEADRPFVETTLVAPLPALGFDRWVSSASGTTPSAALAQSDVVLAVVPESATPSPAWNRAVTAASGTPAASGFSRIVIAVYRGVRAIPPPTSALAALDKTPAIELKSGSAPSDLAKALAGLLPAPRAVAPTSSAKAKARPKTKVTFLATTPPAPAAAAPIDWNADVFSGLLADSVGRHDFSRCSGLVASFSTHVNAGASTAGYKAAHAKADLGALRKKRQFRLMQRYGAAAIDAGTTDFQVRRQYAQALIELKDFTKANAVLTALAKDAAEASDAEEFEALGLMGRLFKQRYVDAPSKANGKWLIKAIDIYASAFNRKPGLTWHGINAASCILRAKRDRLPKSPPEKESRRIATAILATLAAREAEAKTKNEALAAWDHATRVEALVDLGEYKKAAKALDAYLAHPGMDAFEVSSTYRQFDEVLQLGRQREGASILDRLERAAMRLRAGGLSEVTPGKTTAKTATRRGFAKGAAKRPILVRVSDPAWAPSYLPKEDVLARMGTVISISGSTETLRRLLKDPIVVGVEESRRGGGTDCVRSVPFVQVQAQYQGAGGPFSESGDAALVAIIDNGIDVLHEAFRDANGASRIVGIWDQLDTAGAPPKGFGFGRYHSQQDVAGYIKKGQAPDTLCRKNDGHGTHVASIAAGRKCGTFGGGVAPDAPILVVIAAGDEPIGYSTAHVAALQFIDQQATALGKPVVVNLSQGMNAGAHDGKSALEVAFDEFSKGGRLPGRIVVKSAGNERNKRGHAKLTVPANGVDQLVWRCPPGPGLVQLELWWRSANKYKFQLKAPAPTNDVSKWVDETNADVEEYFKKRGQYSMKLVKLHPDNGDNLLKISLNNGAATLPENDWTLTVQAVAVPENGELHAWIERGSGAPTEFASHDTEEMTLSIPGTSPTVVAVGAVDPDVTQAGGPLAIMVGAFSSFGPTRDGREKPDISAPGVKINAAKRDTANDIAEMSGTSMAAPHVTGAIALALSRAARSGGVIPTATQILAVLRQKTRNYSGRWDRGQGYGVLDVTKFLEAF